MLQPSVMLPMQYLKCHEEGMQQLKCYPCSKSSVKRIACNMPNVIHANVIHAIKHISLFFPHEPQPSLFLMSSPKPPLSLIFFSF